MAKRKRRKAGQKRSNQRMPGWLYMFFGLSLGLAVAGGIYINDRRDTPLGAMLLVSHDLPPSLRVGPSPWTCASANPCGQADVLSEGLILFPRHWPVFGHANARKNAKTSA